MDCEHLENLIEPRQNSNILICGSTSSGKTTLLKKLIDMNRSKFDGTIYFSGCEFDEELKQLGIKCNKLDIKKIEAIIKVMEKVKKDDQKYRLCLILDDWIGLVKTNNALFDRISTAGRHLGLTTIFLTQRLSGQVSTTMRSNFRHIFLFNGLQENEVYTVSSLAPGYRTQKQFYDDYYQLCSKRYSFTYLDLCNTDRAVYFCNPINEHGKLNINGFRKNGELKMCRTVVQDQDGASCRRSLQELPEEERVKRDSKIPPKIPGRDYGHPPKIPGRDYGLSDRHPLRINVTEITDTEIIDPEEDYFEDDSYGSGFDSDDF